MTPARPGLRLALLALPILLVLAMGSPGAETPSYPLQSADSRKEVTTAGTHGADTAAAILPDAGTAGVTIDDASEDLTVFFGIGMAVNIIMITVFLVWAAGQWRKTRK